MITEAKFENKITTITWYMRETKDFGDWSKSLYCIKVEPKDKSMFNDYVINCSFSNEAREIFMTQVKKY